MKVFPLLNPISMIFVVCLLHYILTAPIMASGNVVDLTDIRWEALGGFITVDREAVQRKLDEYAQHGGQRLYLNNEPALTELTSSQHVVTFAFANVTAFNFGYEGTISSSGMEFSAAIPFLSTSPNAPQNCALTLGVFYQGERPNVAGINFIFQNYSADIVKLTNDHVRLVNKERELIFNVKRSVPCVTPSPAVQHDYEIVVDGDLAFGVQEPKFPICYRHPIQNQFCNNARNYTETLTRLAPNICQFWSVKGKIESCTAQVTVERITPGFREFLLLPQSGDLRIILSEISFEESTLHMKLPCVE